MFCRDLPVGHCLKLLFLLGRVFVSEGMAWMAGLGMGMGMDEDDAKIRGELGGAVLVVSEWCIFPA